MKLEHKTWATAVVVIVYVMLIGAPDRVQAEGADVITGVLPSTTNWGSAGGIQAYSIGTTSCNIGDEPLEWIDGGGTPTLHPVISQNMFRLLDGRFEQIGQAWLKHGFCALQEEECGSCSEFCGGCCDHLGVGCSDPYGSQLNGIQSGLGPKSEIDPANGDILVWPFSTPGSGTLPGRLQVDQDDLDPTQNPGARYFIEGQYVAHDDTLAGNDNNNASYREALIDSPSSFNLNLIGPTLQQEPGISAWQAADASVQLTNIDIPGDGLMILGHLATDLGGGMWHYEYALYNMNSDRAGQSFAVPIPAGATVTNQGFHDVDYSGEPYSLDDWPATLAGGDLTWATQTQSANPNANALRWATVYNFRFDCDAPPETGDVTVGLFKTGSPATMTVQATRPSADSICTEILSFQAQCTNNGVLRMRMRFTNASHSGESVTFSIDGDPHTVTVQGRRARFLLPGQAGTGSHTIELTDPAGCESPINVVCQ